MFLLPFHSTNKKHRCETFRIKSIQNYIRNNILNWIQKVVGHLKWLMTKRKSKYQDNYYFNLIDLFIFACSMEKIAIIYCHVFVCLVENYVIVVDAVTHNYLNKKNQNRQDFFSSFIQKKICLEKNDDDPLFDVIVKAPKQPIIIRII